MRLYLTPKNIGLISRLLQLQVSELFNNNNNNNNFINLLKKAFQLNLQCQISKT